MWIYINNLDQGIWLVKIGSRRGMLIYSAGQGTECMTDGHSLIYHSSTIPMAVISKGGFCPKGILSILWRGFCPPCKNHEGDYVHPVKSFKGDYVYLVKNMKGISSTYAKISRGDFVQRGYCPDTFYCSNLKFGMRVYVYEYNRNILGMSWCPNYTDASSLT